MDAIKNWDKFHFDKIKGNYPIWPVEAMVKVLYGKYLKRPFDPNKVGKVLDVGCGFGNNLMPFLIKGVDCAGVEISEEICSVTRKAISENGFKNFEIKPGNNREIPFSDKCFDLLISNNVIHYEDCEEKVLAGLREYLRVLKKDGAMFLMTVGPNHEIYQKSKPLGNNTYEISNYDFRDGEKYFYFSNEKNLRFYLEKFFNDVEVGRVHEKLMNVEIDFLIAFCRDPKN